MDVETKKYVITGGASCGKTSLINKLRARGYSVLEETATEVIEDRLDTLLSFEEFLKRQELIFQRQIRRESYDFGDRGEVFLDRSVIDGIAYCRIKLGKVPDFFEKFNYNGRYSGVFMLDLLPLEKSEIRHEKNDAEVKEIHDDLIKLYGECGYDVVFVPVMSVFDRADFVLDYVDRSDK